MTAKEKMDVQLRLSRRVSKYISKNGLTDGDASIMLLGMMYARIDFYVREYVDGCKKNIKKRRKLVNEFIKGYLDYRLNPDPESPYAFKDDEDGQSDVQE